MSGPRGILLALVLVLVAWMAIFATELFQGRVFVLGDAPAYRSFSEFSRARWLASHERTFWNPIVFCGIAAVASLADQRPQYLPDPLLDAYESFTGMPRVPPLALQLLAGLLGMLSTSLLAWRLWGVGAAGMVGAALAWGLMPNLLVPFAYGHDAQFAAASLMPAALLCVDGVLGNGKRIAAWSAALGLSTILAVQCLTGHPQLIVYSGMLVLAFAFERGRRYGRPRRLILVAGATLLAAAIAAAVWWPALLYSASSTRRGVVDLARVARFSLPPRELWTLVWPWASGFASNTYFGALAQVDYPQYLGIIAVLLGISAWRSRGERASDRGAVVFWLAAAGAAVLVAIGTHLGPVYELLHRAVPFWSKFRAPVASLVVAQLGVALLASRHLDSAERLEPRRRDPRSRPGPRPGARRSLLAVAILASVGLTLVWLAPWFRDGYVNRALESGPGMTRSVAEHAAAQARNDLTFRALLVLGAVGLLTVRGLGGQWARLAPWGLAACIGLDLGSVSLPILGGATGTLRDLAAPPPPPLARIAAGDSLHRVLPINLALSLTNAWISWRVPAVAGLHSAVPVSWAEMARHRLFRHPQVLRAFAVQYLGGETPSPPAPEWFDPVVENGRELPVWRLKVHSLPRAYAASQVVSAPNDELALEWLASPQFVPERVAILSCGTADGDYPGSAGCAIRWLRDSPDAITIEVEARERAFLVVADHFFPGWKAELDGQAATLHWANYMLRGVAVPSGRHTVRMTYRPEGWQLAVSLTRVGLWLWGLCALGIAMWAARAWFTRHARALASHGHALV